ncbi:hypothetical protein Q5M85_19045 [Paraclostridium bifermentans]|nr:hypothetical protein [Paraclostridium bifermentans]
MIKKFLNRKGQNYAVVHLNQNFKENSVDDRVFGFIVKLVKASI